MTKSDITFQIKLAIEDAVINSNSEYCSRGQAKQEIAQAQSIVLEYFNDMYDKRYKDGFLDRAKQSDLEHKSDAQAAIVSAARSFLEANDERTLAYCNNNSENAFEIECDQRDDGTILAEWIIQSQGESNDS